MLARRTSAGGTSAAAAIASAMTPSSAPCRSSPSKRPARNCCSGSVAAPSKRSSASSRRAAEPLPAIARSASRSRAAAASVSVGSRAGAPIAARSAAGPRLTFPPSTTPDSQATAVSRSSGASARKHSASKRTFSLRLRVAATAADTAASSWQHHDGATLAARALRSAASRTAPSGRARRPAPCAP